MEVEDQTHALVRTYVLVAWTAVVLLAVGLGLVYRRVAVGRLIYAAENRAVALAQRFVATRWPEFRDFVREASVLRAEELRAHPTAAEIHDALRDISHGTAVVRMRLHAASGLIVASTEPDEIGRVTSDTVVLAMGAGRWYGSYRLNADSELVRGSTVEGTGEEAGRVITRVVIHVDEPQAIGEAGGVLSIHQDVTPALRRIGFAQVLGMGGTIVAATAALGVLWLRRRRVAG